MITGAHDARAFVPDTRAVAEKKATVPSDFAIGHRRRVEIQWPGQRAPILPPGNLTRIGCISGGGALWQRDCCPETRLVSDNVPLLSRLRTSHSGGKEGDKLTSVVRQRTYERT